MKKLTYIVCLVLGFAASGCFEILEDVYVKADGSGDYVMTIDFSEMLSDPFMGEMMKQGMKEEMKVETLEIDSLMPIGEMSGGGLPPTLTDSERDILDRTEMRMQLSESQGKAQIVIKFAYNEVAELNTFQGVFGKIGEEDTDNPAAGPMGGFMDGLQNGTSLWSISGRTLTREVDPGDSAEMLEGMDEETMSMMKMMMADASFTTTYHLPGNVKKCTIPNATVDGKNVVVSYGFLEILEDMPETGGMIKFKKR